MPNPMLQKLPKLMIGMMSVLLVATSATAEVLAFNQFLSGGGGGNAALERKRVVTGSGASICMDVSERRAADGNRVVFMILSRLTMPKSRIGDIAIDTGRHTGLFTNVSIMMHSAGLKPKLAQGGSHAFLPGFSIDHWVVLPYPDGITFGKFVAISAALAPGKTFADVVAAMREGLNPATAATGLRVGVIATHLLGGPPPGQTATISDDGGFSMTMPSPICLSRP